MERLRGGFTGQGGGQEGERKTEKGNFVVTVEDYQELYDFLRPHKGYIRFAPQEFQLGYTSLTGVLQEAELFVVTTGQEALFGATLIGNNDRLDFRPLYSVKHLSRRLLRAGIDVDAQEDPDNEKVLDRRTNISSIFFTGIFSEFELRERVENSTFSLEINNPSHIYSWKGRKINNPKQFRRKVNSFRLVVQALVEAVYVEANQEIPRVELVLRKEPIDKGVLLVDMSEGGMRPLTETERPAVTFEEIGGQREAVEKMKEVALALKHPKSFQRWGSWLPKGILLVGPPGNGKTLLGKAMAHEADANFVPVNISDILIKWVGSSERKVTALFNDAKRREGKTILFFDEVDALGRSRDKATHEHTASLLLTINQNMDGMRENPNVIMIGTTNRKEDIDSALLREGRFSMIVEVSLPDLTGREEILAIHLSKAEKEASARVFEDIDLGLLARSTEGASGARLAEILRRATWRRAVQEAKAKEEGRQVELPLITTEEILKVIESYEAR